MRFYFPDIEKPKAAARFLHRLRGHGQLSTILEAIASATGYRDWFELSQTRLGVSQRVDCPPLYAVRDVILLISKSLDMSIGDVHFAVSKSRLLFNQPLSIDHMLQVHATLWRKGLFGTPARGKPGTVVRVKSPGEQGVAYLKAPGRPTHVVLDNGVGIRADFEVVTPREPLPDFVPSRLWLPYGYWTLSDSSTVIFSRDYKPMWHILGEQAIRMNPWVWVQDIVQQSYFSSATVSELVWNKGLPRERAIAYLDHHRLFHPPKLLDAMPCLLEKGVDSVSQAVDRLQEIDTCVRAV